MAPPLHAENFVSIRTLHPRVTWRDVSRYQLEKAETATELDYRDLLSEANEDFFHREYTIALQNYLALRQKILVQSHPELPRHQNLVELLGVEAVQIDPARIFELSRRYLISAKPGQPIVLPTSEAPVIQLDEVDPNPKFKKFAGLGMDPGAASQATLDTARTDARRAVLARRWDAAVEQYAHYSDLAADAGEFRQAADLTAEWASVLATYADRNRPAALKRASAGFQRASLLYGRLGDTTAQQAMQANLRQLADERGAPRTKELVGTLAPHASVPTPAGQVMLEDLVEGRVAMVDLEVEDGSNGLAPPQETWESIPTPVSSRAYLVPDDGVFRTSSALVTSVAARPVERREVGLVSADGPVRISLAADAYEPQLVDAIYTNRIAATTLDGIAWREIVETTFVAYIPHLYFYVLPLAIGDTYLALGRYQQAIDEYQSALAYPYLNTEIEVPDVWRRLAGAYLRFGDDRFRRGGSAAAKTLYERIIGTDLAVPSNSPLYQPAAFAPLRTQAAEVAKKLSDQPSAPVNPKVSQIVTTAYGQLSKIAAGLNYLGLSDDHYPIQRFKYLQAAANFLAEQAIQAERTFIQFRSNAEQQKFERLQLENAVRVNEIALQAETKRLQDAQLEVEAAQRTRQLTETRRANAQANLTDWDTIGRELTSVNAALSWASNAANDQDITYTGVRYHGESHDYSGDVEDFFDTVGEVREWLNFDLQRNRLARQVAETAGEVAVAQVREQQAAVRLQIQALNRELAAVRLEGAREILDYAEDRTFDEDLWFRLAADLQDLARNYLDMAIHAAFLMQRAYDLEFDRNLEVIRLDYGVGGDTEGLLGGDYLKRDIASFTLDYLEHAVKQNPMRLLVSLRTEFPQGFNLFQEQGILPFRTDLEIFDRAYPGTCRRKLKRVEVFVEGLVPLEGVHGSLQHTGISTEWRRIGGAWQKHARALPVERMVLSSYQFRRDLAVFQPSEELLGLFENLGPQGEWTLEIPRSGNDLDYQSISDVRLALYFDSDYDDELAAHLDTVYDDTGGRTFVLSSRFHYPDEYFRLDADRAVAFSLPAQRFAYNQRDRKLEALTVRLVPLEPGTSVGVQELTVSRESDGASVTASTDADGRLASDPTTMAPFATFKDGDPADVFSVALGDDVDTAAIGDVQLALSYTFTYRPDGSV